MPKRSSKPRDLNSLAASIVGDATNDAEVEPESRQAVAGRAGGLKGGHTRADRLTPERRAEIAKKAAQARWRSS